MHSLVDTISDDVCLVLATAESHQVQTPAGHLREFHPSNDLPSVNFWISRDLHPLQMDHRLDERIDGSPIAVKHADWNVLITWNG